MPDEYDELIDEAYEALEEERFDDALGYGRQAIDQEPGGAAGHYLAGTALVEMRHYEEALPYLRNALRIDHHYPDARFCLASVQFSTCNFPAARVELQRVLLDEPNMPDAHYWTAMCLEREGDLAAADASFKRAADLDGERFRLPARLTREEFDAVVEQAITRLPPYFRAYLDGLHMVVDDVPPLELLLEFDPPLAPEVLGLFVGTPLVERSLLDQVPSLPDRIHIFRRNVERFAHSRDQLVEEIRITLLHELGHAMGLDDEGLERYGYD